MTQRKPNKKTTRKGGFFSPKQKRFDKIKERNYILSVSFLLTPEGGQKMNFSREKILNLASKVKYDCCGEHAANYMGQHFRGCSVTEVVAKMVSYEASEKAIAEFTDKYKHKEKI